MLQGQGCVDAKLWKTEREEMLYVTFPLFWIFAEVSLRYARISTSTRSDRTGRIISQQ